MSDEILPLRALAGPDSADLLREFVAAFVAASGIAPGHAAEVTLGLEISASPSAVQVELPAMGGIKGGFPWDGTLPGLRRALRDAAEEFGDELNWERREFGATEWD